MATKDKDAFGPWNPGLKSTIPDRLMPRVTLFDPRFSFLDWKTAKDLSDITGMKPKDLAVIRPERLALHSVLIRVTTQTYVEDGPDYADLGLNLRSMADRIYEAYVRPEMETVRAAYDRVKMTAEAEINDLLDPIFTDPEPLKSKGLFARWFAEPAPDPTSPTDRAHAAVELWKEEHNEDVASAVRRALARTLSSVLNRHGRLMADRKLISDVALGLVLNRLGSAAVGAVVERIFVRAVKAEGYVSLPSQAEPVVLNVKGASAAGKSTIRDEQKRIAARLGLNWADFAIISPDYWRKALIDYDGLGEDYKYAAMMCGQELELIDRKLDILMAVKGAQGRVPHMLIDRFRFDSFATDHRTGKDSTLLTRFGARIYLFFMITPPSATVERAWFRGLSTGRYKAVDDLLYHNVEAYNGMPDLFFNWAQKTGRWVHYEFLDNSVALGERPRTIADGKNGNLLVRDLEAFCNIDRFGQVNVEAQRPEDVFLEQTGKGKILRRAFQVLNRVDVLSEDGKTICAQSRNGKIQIDPKALPSGWTAEHFGRDISAQSPLPEFEPDPGSEVIGTVGP